MSPKLAVKCTTVPIAESYLCINLFIKQASVLWLQYTNFRIMIRICEIRINISKWEDIVVFFILQST